MPVYHSSFNDFAGQECCKASILPLKTTVKGPAPPAKSDDIDIVDEALSFFRANVLFRNFEPKGPADLTLCYLTIYISECLRYLMKHKTRKDGEKMITQLSMSGNFKMPGDIGFCLPGFFTNPANRREADTFRAYFRQLREETARRVLTKAYSEDGTQNKWWMSFAKKKFMNITST